VPNPQLRFHQLGLELRKLLFEILALELRWPFYGIGSRSFFRRSLFASSGNGWTSMFIPASMASFPCACACGLSLVDAWDELVGVGRPFIVEAVSYCEQRWSKEESDQSKGHRTPEYAEYDQNEWSRAATSAD
jgi:hypothetical protein